MHEVFTDGLEFFFGKDDGEELEDSEDEEDDDDDDDAEIDLEQPRKKVKV